MKRNKHSYTQTMKMTPRKKRIGSGGRIRKRGRGSSTYWKHGRTEHGKEKHLGKKKFARRYLKQGCSKFCVSRRHNIHKPSPYVIFVRGEIMTCSYYFTALNLLTFSAYSRVIAHWKVKNKCWKECKFVVKIWAPIKQACKVWGSYRGKDRSCAGLLCGTVSSRRWLLLFGRKILLPFLVGRYCSTALTNLSFRGPCIVIYSYNKSQRYALISQIYFWNRTLHVSDSFSVRRQESSTVQTASSQHNLCV